MIHDENTVARFMAKVAQPAHGGACWVWTGWRNVGGYGMFRVKGKDRPAHQIAWEIANKVQFPAGKFALHGCDNPPCVNFDHIRPGTQSENIIEARAKGRFTQHRKRKDKCSRGHDYSIYGNRQVCRTCWALTAKQRYKRGNE